MEPNQSADRGLEEKMRIHTEIVDAYLQAENLSRFSSLWLYMGRTEQGVKNIFQDPPDDPAKRAAVSKIKDEIITHAGAFTPCNAEIWDALFEDWRHFLEDTVLDLIVGCPEPYDAFVSQGPDGKHHMVFDLLCWEKYVGAISLSGLSQNLLTHELFHVMVGRRCPDIEAAEAHGAYPDQLDAITFNEGFAHLVSYRQQEIQTVSWNGKKLTELYLRSAEKMKSALREKDPERQKQFVYEANFGDYERKYACMCGMIFLGKQWQKGGVSALKQLFDQGYHGFAEKSTEPPPACIPSGQESRTY